MEENTIEELLVELIEALEDFLLEIEHDQDAMSLTMEEASPNDTIH